MDRDDSFQIKNQAVINVYIRDEQDKKSFKNMILTSLQAADPQRLSCVQREAMMTVLDVGLTRHGIKVGLQWQFHVATTWLHLEVVSSAVKNYKVC